ncbi:sensor histidine kinase [Enterococcus faecalis]
MKRLEQLCHQYTNLSESDIKELQRTARYLSSTTLYQSADVFIDVYKEMSQQALVVYHKPPAKTTSLYIGDVVGMEALLKNEPGVLRTMQTSLNSIGLLAVTQENRLIKQNIYPIRNEHRTIGVIIVEIAADEEIQADLQKEELNNCQLAKVAKSTSQVDALFIDQLAEAVLIFDAAGHLLITNHNAQELYRKLGYRDNIIGMSYDNLSIDYTTFEYVFYQMKYKMSNQERRTQSPEAKKVLHESVNRIMAIAATHELLSKQVKDDVALRQTLEAVMYNFRHLFQGAQPIEMMMDVDPAIMVSSEQMGTMSRVVKDLLQSIFDHAFEPQTSGVVKLSGTLDNKMITITVTDNGKGYDVHQSNEPSLGLMIVKSYVKDKLKGKITIESNKQGTKTCFYFEQNTSDVVH